MQTIIRGALALAIAGTAVTPAAAETFDGAYAGIEAGWNQNKIGSASTDIGRINLDKSRDSIRAGIFAGYNYRATEQIVLSAEGAFNMGFDDQVTRSGTAGLTSIDPEYAFNVGARAGYLVTPETLLYARGSYENLRASVRSVDASGARYDKDSFDGWSVGGGVERAINQRVSARIEYRYSDLGGGGTKFERHQALAGVAYHF